MEYNDIYSKAKELIVDYLRVDEKEVSLDTDLVDDLFADSIALVELGFRFSETFSVPMIEARPELFIVKNIVQHLYEKMHN
ncbi:UNVERIFIED_CONTAM: acyl carrier protein [Acetivibrio alkalicellulosi]